MLSSQLGRPAASEVPAPGPPLLPDSQWRKVSPEGPGPVHPSAAPAHASSISLGWGVSAPWSCSVLPTSLGPVSISLREALKALSGPWLGFDYVAVDIIW